MESLLALTLLTLTLAVYSPSAAHLTKQVQESKTRTESLRVLFEQTQRMKEGHPPQSVMLKGRKTYEVQELDGQKGIRVTNGLYTEEVYLVSFPETNAPLFLPTEEE